MTFSDRRTMAGIMAAALIWAAPSAVVAQNANVLRVQGAQQPTYVRLILDLPAGVPYQVSHQGTDLSVTIAGSFEVDFSALNAVSLKQVSSPRARRAGGETILSFNVPADAGPSAFRSGGYLVLDVYSGNSAPAIARRQAAASGATTQPQTPASTSSAAQETTTAKPQGPEQAADTGGKAPDSKVPEPTAGTETQAAESTGPSAQENTEQKAPEGNASQTAQPAAKAPAVSLDPVAPPPDQNGGNLARLEDHSLVTRGGTTDIAPFKKDVIPDRLQVTGSLPENSAAANVMSASVKTIDSGISLTFAWPEEVAAAAFKRGGYLWVVFDQPYKFDAKSLLQAGKTVTERIRSIDVEANPDALVLRMAIRAGQNAVVERQEKSWILSLKDTPAKPRFPLAPERQGADSQGQQIYIPATDIGRKITVEDPAIGDNMIILPMLHEGRGMAMTYNYAAVNILETSQGIAIIPLSDLVNVERFPKGVAIRLSGNNVLSASHLPSGAGPGDRRGGKFHRLIDFAAWRLGPKWEYRKSKDKLFYELSLQPANRRNGVRWKIARFYLAFGRAAECLGMLDRMLSEDPLLAQNTDYLAVRGVANFKMGRLKEAAKDLGSKELEAEQDADLWRTQVAEAMGHYKEALDHYRRGKDIMGTYDDSDRADIQLAVVRSALATGDLEMAQRELELLNGLKLTDAQMSESVYQSARIAERQGQVDKALQQFDDLSNAPQHWIAARARYSRILIGLKKGDLSPVDAIDQLERLRYSWRGDRFEVQLIDKLSELYFQTKQYAKGLEILRQAVSYFPELSSERKFTLRMGNVFRDLYLGHDADDMTPIAAISLFYKFRELTPLGADGDLMIRRLADRLVSVDLLDRAAELLQYQVKVRTEGAARAQIAAKLAKIYILDKKPESALEIIRATREPRLPEDINANRRWVEARALTELGRYEEAEVMLENDRSAGAEVLRADIYWGAKNWAKFADTARHLLGDGWRHNESLTSLQRLNLIRLTIALTFMEDRAGLVELRRRYGNQMSSGDFANAFDLLTNDQKLSGRQLGKIASQIASVEKLQSFMRDYRKDFSGR
ncbi:hypothetical protein [Kordiimonas marina]|uniref:hypothetical protein n=1 Tax=Kordiimonas marina TaxID=2872312 RepID=UPI001FF69DFC|nr:hypothetical protein [Kordiimonas marina]MCJ9430349.1 hypothetical protein [Kordiimonas marina]